MHSQRIARIERLRESLTDVFVRIRQLRMQLHVRTPGLGAYVEDEEAEMKEIEDLKLTLIEEEAEEERRRKEAELELEQAQQRNANSNLPTGFVDHDTSLPYAESMPNSLPTSPAGTLAGISAVSSPAGLGLGSSSASPAAAPPVSDFPPVAPMPLLFERCSLTIPLPNGAAGSLHLLTAAIPDQSLFYSQTDSSIAGRVKHLNIPIFAQLDVAADLSRLQMALASLPPCSVTLLPAKLRALPQKECEAILMEVQLTPELDALLTLVAATGQRPARWQPHCPLAYVKPGLASPTIKLLQSLVKAPALQFIASDYEFVHRDGSIDQLSAAALA